MHRYIDADAFDADCRKRYCTDCNNYNGVKCRACWVDDMLGDVDDAPTVSPDEVRGVGKWTRHVLKNANTPWGYDCSACGEWFVIGDDTAEQYNYCPNCGAKMEVE